jgi:hypothetical protein
MWGYLSGQYDKAIVRVEKVKIPDNLKNKNYITDNQFKNELQLWLNELWQKQDEKLS